MNRRDFLKSALTLAALAPLTRLAAKAGADGDKSSDFAKGAQVTRRRYKNTALTLPMLGFGMMRLPRLDPRRPDIDLAETERMFRRALEAGVNYFDTAYFYHNGLSVECVASVLGKFPRDSYYLADKLPVRSLRRKSDVERIWNEQLAKCRVDYFDFYLLHNLNRERWEDVRRFGVYEFLKERQKEGKIRKLGFSFHDEPEILETIASAYEWDFAQIQLNYLDWTLYRSKEQYEILTKRGIPVVVMEPLRGGALANLNDEATRVFRAADPKASPASWAFRFVGSLPNVICILSGMTKMAHLEENIGTFTNFKALDDRERAVIESALAAYRKAGAIPCSACRYCTPCPVGVDIPRIFGLYNHYKMTGNYMQFRMIYDKLAEDERASACVKCGACLKKCPQKINIPEQLAMIDAELKRRPPRRRADAWEPAEEYFA